MTRTAEFSRGTKRKAWDRADGCCEAEGIIYGLGAFVRCGADLFLCGVAYDHINPEANSHDNSLENCAAVCPRCHDFKTAKRDVPMIAKTARQADKARGIKRKSRPMAGSRASGLKKKMSGEVVRR